MIQFDFTGSDIHVLVKIPEVSRQLFKMKVDGIFCPILKKEMHRKVT